MTAKGVWVTKVCEECEASFEVPIYRAKRRRFCSRKCQGKAKVAHLNQTRKPATHNPSWFKPGDNAGEGNFKWCAPITRTCKHCGNSFELKPWELRRDGRTGEYCSKKCQGEYRKTHQSGENSPHWIGGAKTSRGRGWRKIRAVVVQEQGGVCENCGKPVGDSLPVHHIRPWRCFKTAEEANRRQNLIGLCQSCHMKAEQGTARAGTVEKAIDIGWQKACKECHKEFMARNPKIVRCDVCLTRVCQHCGKPFRIRLWNDANKHCSTACRRANHHGNILI